LIGFKGKIEVVGGPRFQPVLLTVIVGVPVAVGSGSDEPGIMRFKSGLPIVFA